MTLKNTNLSANRKNARKRAVKSEVTPANAAESWTVEIPFQYVFVEACTYEEDLQPEIAMKFIEDKLETVCRVRVREALCGDSRIMRDVSVGHLRATCPFCETGHDQVLSSKNWVYIHDWRGVEIDATVQSEDEYVQKHSTDIRLLTNHTATSRLLCDTFFLEAIKKWGEAGIFPMLHRKSAYGIDFAAIREGMNGQLSFHMPEIGLKSVTYGIEGYFGGLYQCPHCGGVFAAVYRDRRQKRRLGKYELFSYYDKGIDELINTSARQKYRMISSSNPFGLLPTMTAHVELSGDSVSLDANIAGCWHRLEFNTAIGTFLLDGSTYIKDCFKVEEFLEHPLVASGIFSSRKLTELLRRMLPELPNGVEFDFEDNRGFRNLHILISANRFIGYPSSFYSASDPISSMRHLYPLGSGLPRNHSDISMLYKMTGLPDKKSLKRSLYTRPDLLLALLNTPELPFRNVDILRRFFELREAESLLNILNFEANSCAGWRWLASVKSERAVFDYITSNTPDVVLGMSHLFNGAIEELKDAVQEQVAGASMESVEKILACQKWQNEHPNIGLDTSYVYDEFAEKLELDIGRYTFVLPESPRDFVLASVELKNCLNTLVFLSPDPNEPVIVLMKERAKFVAGLRVNREGAVITALAKCNKPIAECSDLNAAVEKWAECKSLLLAIDNECEIDDF